jgi:hypothetical protein
VDKIPALSRRPALADQGLGDEGPGADDPDEGADGHEYCHVLEPAFRGSASLVPDAAHLSSDEDDWSSGPACSPRKYGMASLRRHLGQRGYSSRASLGAFPLPLSFAHVQRLILFQDNP